MLLWSQFKYRLGSDGRNGLNGTTLSLDYAWISSHRPQIGERRMRRFRKDKGPCGRRSRYANILSVNKMCHSLHLRTVSHASEHALNRKTSLRHGTSPIGVKKSSLWTGLVKWRPRESGRHTETVRKWSVLLQNNVLVVMWITTKSHA
jgi:hypothetical protein